jgi:hypothetical protein
MRQSGLVGQRLTPCGGGPVPLVGPDLSRHWVIQPPDNAVEPLPTPLPRNNVLGIGGSGLAYFPTGRNWEVMTVVRLPVLAPSAVAAAAAAAAAYDDFTEVVFRLDTEESISGITVLGRPAPSNDIIFIQHAKR